MRITDQLDQALDDLIQAGFELDTTRACEEVMFARSGIVDAVTSMRMAMDDPTCIDRLDNGAPAVVALEQFGRSLVSDRTADAAMIRNAARTQHADLVKAIAECARKADACVALLAAGDLTPAKRSLRTAESKAVYIANMVARWQPRYATPKERAETSRDLDPGCVSCARTQVVPGVKRWVPVSRADLCDWCYRWKLRTGEAPSQEVVEQHHRGRVRVSA